MALEALIRRSTLIVVVMLHIYSAFRLVHHVQKLNRRFSPFVLQAGPLMATTQPLRDADEIELAGLVSGSFLHVGDVVLLTGDLGAGKTTFSRGVIRRSMNDFDMSVTSPTFLLNNVYTSENKQIINHMDLYRLPKDSDLRFLGIPSIFTSSISLIEWPDRLGQFIPQSYLSVEIRINPIDETRVIHFQGHGTNWTTNRIEPIVKDLESKLRRLRLFAN